MEREVELNNAYVKLKTTKINKSIAKQMQEISIAYYDKLIEEFTVLGYYISDDKKFIGVVYNTKTNTPYRIKMSIYPRIYETKDSDNELIYCVQIFDDIKEYERDTEEFQYESDFFNSKEEARAFRNSVYDFSNKFDEQGQFFL